MRPPPVKGQLVTIAVLIAALVVLLLFRDKCAQGMGNLFQALDVPAGDGGTPKDAAPPKRVNPNAPLDGGSVG